MIDQPELIPAPPIAPGEILRDRFLTTFTQEQFARALNVSRYSVNQIVNGRRALTAEMALRISKVTSTTPDFWLNLQRDVDIYEARRKLKDELSKLVVLRPEKPLTEIIRQLPDD
ncbi:HigA family addiction module antitoxin [Rhizobium mongolense]